MFDLRSNCVLSGHRSPTQQSVSSTKVFISILEDTGPAQKMQIQLDSYSQAKFSFHTFLTLRVSRGRANRQFSPWCAQVPAYVLYHSPHSDA
jgi:hypothetical protein